ncbi:melanocyte protein PMEL [Poecile atricapillus]|uniref:melanocyte protein PMEL n=1 Tax=Poecile atricapillus TaxID=48891 RepID=UPI002739B90F|nr:melanocyte protein PMEL [Poecile atricapillus]
MRGLGAIAVLGSLLLLAEAQRRASGRSRGRSPAWSGRPGPFRAWDSELYQPWRDGTRDCWRGGDVTFDISNDAPTMAGAEATFSIALRFPGNQSVLPDGRVVWSQNCTVNGQRDPGTAPKIPGCTKTHPEPSQNLPEPSKTFLNHPKTILNHPRTFLNHPRTAPKIPDCTKTILNHPRTGIESVAIVQVVPEDSGSSVELTVTCEGGLPEEVCTVVADPECRTAEEERCSPVSPSPGCELVLRQDFNRSGLFCLNVSLANGNGLAVATTRVAVGGAAPVTGRTTLFVGLVLVAAALGTAAFTYRRVKYTALPPPAPPARGWLSPSVTGVTVRRLLQRALGGSPSGESSPLLRGHSV